MQIVRWVRRVAPLCVVLGLAPGVSAQDFPSRQPVRLIVTFAPGGGADTIART